ncbi:endonuclease/exonuclease/phosphatase family protein [Flagellimonas aequoris]|uniref:Endonuclease/exonuclease/phosphatase family protein n=1 Tax=Flagellimonas aequoris TaxID=2306997 RepID=A0A418N990_9FLAO|nr:endonuclease/exonuclease/phosphatase family protein [Allomuricauda aequoris]RIV71572.1 endonuclease/exonuclease/phosphatase family protein [Allomuricauda aequoris]TXK03137.1 endonuclease/exonuclease/phosphatase family protein [Allomuricauda aequoris]
MSGNLKITSWNVEWLDKLLDNVNDKKQKRIDAIAEELNTIDADVYCLQEGLKGEVKMELFCSSNLGGKYVPVKAVGNDYKMQGRQWIWFLVKKELKDQVSLLPTKIYDEFSSSSWDVNYWSDFETAQHKHYRHPQVLILNWQDVRLELIGLHTKSKYVQSGKSDWNAGGDRKKDFIKNAIKARIKMTTEVANVRDYINTKFNQVPNPAIMVMGDLNDGPGKEFFEKQFIFFDLLSNLQGDVFEAERFLNHALFDFEDNLRWSVHFKDFIDEDRDPKILLDHILFTQSLVDGSLPIIIESQSGYVEHEIHDLINANNPKYAQTSDHKPVSVVISKKEEP